MLTKVTARSRPSGCGVLAYKQVPEEVFRRLCSAPNPAAYWEDRIAEEYPKGTPMTSNAEADAAKKLSDLLGGAQ
jgi:hypothetical protein